MLVVEAVTIIQDCQLAEAVVVAMELMVGQQELLVQQILVEALVLIMALQ
jgi:hypothetical protein